MTKEERKQRVLEGRAHMNFIKKLPSDNSNIRTRAKIMHELREAGKLSPKGEQWKYKRARSNESVRAKFEQSMCETHVIAR